VRKGDWKAVRRGNDPWQLYDIAADRTELNDLAARHPEKLKELVDLWNDWDGKCTFIGE